VIKASARSRPASPGRSQALVEGAPKPVLEGEQGRFDSAKKKLEEAGGKVEVK